MSSFYSLGLIFFSSFELVSSSPATVRSRIAPAVPHATQLAAHADERFYKRQAFAPVTTCGYLDGKPENPRTADPGYGCRVDTANGLWGFCPTSVLSAKDCGLAGLCIDNHSCTTGCGRLSDRADITTFTCDSEQFCSTALLINGPDQSFEYIACGDTAAVDSLFAVPNTVEATTTSASSTESSASLATSTQPPTTSDAQSSTVLDPIGSILPSSTPGSTPAPTEQKSTNIGPIVGGVIGGLTVICLTILGVVLIRRKRGTTEKVAQPLGYTYDHPSNFVELSTDSSTHLQKGQHWDNNHGPVEMYGYHVNVEPVELPGKVLPIRPQ
ncbi:hypothetical protein CC77DRAFT_1017273 [Alternaria alternata]|uniref:Mid2 domain-containing protein n=2 Tax=Alternaria alternata complex TaxID=187734 RepID=A0A177DVY2_ALTAL|nr:hypothetical protein CC77DRAFT_1017273 [Alternaria alternata]RII05953.1 hypothetical protein CUC08_Gglean009168 [Alternaria sp. MG1]RYN26716.1 hypothetical protein AA0115_g7010 [Alternaria tenuissima]OAG23618.1 hypothetical protein CC77DRAFT_1017273 [Alternaria alternata]RYN69444.1 hypothetical protein AA0118_g219 [Alternaria tenuissima]RYN84590.1 hypothetical protein AA0117_g816 [Alternaria alternata]